MRLFKKAVFYQIKDLNTIMYSTSNFEEPLYFFTRALWRNIRL